MPQSNTEGFTKNTYTEDVSKQEDNTSEEMTPERITIADINITTEILHHRWQFKNNRI
jgi:hypothetical protein